MQEATPETVLGDFAERAFVHGRDTTVFSRRDDRFFVRTTGADGGMHEYPVAYTFGVTPLQQYLIPFADGRYQTLSVAWDSRPLEEGGGHWFELYPDEDAGPAGPLHWTRPSQTWNAACAACHSTFLEPGFDAETSTFRTTWVDLDVSCEACHGPGSAHVAAAKSTSTAPPENWALTAALEPFPARWSRAAGAATAQRVRPLPSRAELDACAPCHSRRAPLRAQARAEDHFLDDYEPSLLHEGLYHPDGQIRDEVYVYGSFVQSRMYAAGVTCSDCHDPHTLAVRAPGNALCTRCHDPGRFDTDAHHLHQPGSVGSLCVDCHMPSTTYMQVDPRRDHGLRVPRPDVATALGTPDACTGCHVDRGPVWAAQVLEEHYGAKNPREHFATALQAGRMQDPVGVPLLTVLVSDTARPAIVRATAASLLGGYRRARVPDAILAALADSEPLLRIGALYALEGRSTSELAPLVSPLLDDSVRAVRVRAARLVAPLLASPASPEQAARFATVEAEVDGILHANAGRSSAWVGRAEWDMARGRPVAAEADLRRALALDSLNLPAWLNLADLQRALGQDDRASATLAQAQALHGSAPALQHALGLLRVREGRLAAALPLLEQAAGAGRENARFGYVYAVAVAAAGDTLQAVRVLEDVLSDHPYDADVLSALVGYAEKLGESARARVYAERLAAVAPEAPGTRALPSAR
ncbi:MAG: tetratricopeptide repeat protein [Gemmatimonadota bacterium]